MEYLKIVTALLGAVGTAGGIILALSSFLGRIWASRILEADRARYAREKKSITLSIKAYEIKTSTIQAELNQVILKLASALSAFYNACYVLVEVGGLHAKYARHDPDMFRTLGLRFQDSSSILHDQLMAAKLYLDADAFEKAREFEARIYEIKQSACALFGSVVGY